MDIIKTFAASGLCGTCYRDLPATIEYRADGSAWIRKTCPTHGPEQAMVERDSQFLEQKLYATSPTNRIQQRYQDTVIEVTDRCNVACKHCYHDPDNDIQDRSLEWVVEMARSCHTKNICLMGAEPTMRRDLPELIRQIKALPWGDQQRGVAIYTNGIKLQNREYVQELSTSGLDAVNISVHHPEYHDARVWRAVSSALDNLRLYDIKLGQVSFTVENKIQMGYALDRMQWLREHGFRFSDISIRSPATIGVEFEQEQEIFVSDLYRWLQELAQERGYDFRYDIEHSTSYWAGVFIDDSLIMLIHWPSAASVNTAKTGTGPMAKFLPNTYGNIMLQAIMRDGWKKGWWQGQRLVDDTATTLTWPTKK